ARRRRGQGVDARGEPAQLAPLGGGCFLREKNRRLDLERLAQDEMASHILAGRDAHPGSCPRTALDESFDFPALQRLRDRQETHPKLRRELAARNRLAERKLAPNDPLTDDAVGFGGETRRHRSGASVAPSPPPAAPHDTDRPPRD